MKPPSFEYHAPRSLAQTLDLLARYGADARILAGGQSLMPQLNMRQIRPASLVDVNGVRGLDQIKTGPQALTIGAMVRQRDAELSADVRAHCPLLAEALPLIAHQQIRNRGTVGGSLAFADPSAEIPTVAATLDAEILVRSARRQRTLGPEQFFTGVHTTALAPDEIVAEVRFPAWPAGTGWSFQEVVRRFGDLPLAAAASVIRLGSDGKIAEARLTLAGVGPVPIRLRQAERQLRGEQPGPDLFAAAVALADDAMEPASNVHASAAYRRHVVKVLARRALEEAVSRARGAG